MLKEKYAQKAGEKLAARLQEETGTEWSVRVYQNMGWHYTAFRNFIQVYEYPRGEATSWAAHMRPHSKHVGTSVIGPKDAVLDLERKLYEAYRSAQADWHTVRESWRPEESWRSQ